MSLLHLIANAASTFGGITTVSLRSHYSNSTLAYLMVCYTPFTAHITTIYEVLLR